MARQGDDLRALEQAAITCRKRGDLSQAAVLFERLLELSPENLPALKFLSVSNLVAGRVMRALALLERAIALDPDDAALHKNLGLARRDSGNLGGALAALDEAIRINPDFLAAHLHRGAVLEEMGRRDDALRAFLRAFALAESAGIINATLERLPPGIRDVAQQASAIIREARGVAIASALAPVQDCYGDPALVRVHRAVGALLDGQHNVGAAPLQRPTLMCLPDMPGQPWFEREQFAWLSRLEAQTDRIRAEMLHVLETREGFRPFVDIPPKNPGAAYWQSVNHSRAWDAYFFYRDGARIGDHSAACPMTSQLLDSSPLIRIAGHSPESLYSVLQPGAHIPPHTGVLNCRLVVHLPLVIPESCGIRVGTETRTWEEGRCLVFDDTFEHEAWNRSPHTRVVLIFDIWNPHLSTAEQEAVRVAVEALGNFNRQYGTEEEAGNPSPG